MVNQFVISGAEQRVTGVAPPAGLVNHALRVFDANPDRKCLGLHGDTGTVQHDKGVA